MEDIDSIIIEQNYLPHFIFNVSSAIYREAARALQFRGFLILDSMPKQQGRFVHVWRPRQYNIVKATRNEMDDIINQSLQINQLILSPIQYSHYLILENEKDCAILNISRECTCPNPYDYIIFFTRVN